MTPNLCKVLALFRRTYPETGGYSCKVQSDLRLRVDLTKSQETRTYHPKKYWEIRSVEKGRVDSEMHFIFDSSAWTCKESENTDRKTMISVSQNM